MVRVEAGVLCLRMGRNLRKGRGLPRGGGGGGASWDELWTECHRDAQTSAEVHGGGVTLENGSLAKVGG